MNRNMIFFSISLAIWGIGEGMFLNFQPLYLQALGANPILIGAILGGIGAAITVAHLPAGYLADRIGRRPLLWAAWIMATAATWVMALSKSLPWFVFGAGLYGLTAFVAGPMNSYITTARGQWSVIRALTLVSAFYHAGSILGPLLGGWVGESLGLRWSFFVAGVLFLGSTLFILRIDDQPVERLSATGTTTYWRAFWNRRFFTFIAIIFLTMLTLYIPQPLSQNFLQNVRTLDLQDIGLLLAARSAGVVTLNLLLGHINPRYGFILAQIAMGAFSALIWKGSGLPWYLAGYFMLGGFQTARSLVTALGRVLTNPENIGFAYGIFETLNGLVFLIGAPLAGYLFSLNPTYPYQVGLAGVCLTALISTFFIPIHPGEIG